MKRPLFVTGMHGMGDCLHQRAVMRELMKDHDVWLGSSWCSMYHDLIEQGLKVVRRPTHLRTQTKNAHREMAHFSKVTFPEATGKKIVITYNSHYIKAHGGVLQGMMARLGLDYSEADFRLPIPKEWLDLADRMVDAWNPKKPILIYRPLVVRKEWHYNGRNPDYPTYAKLFEQIRDDYYIVSIADLIPNLEWIVGKPQPADKVLHKGELSFELMAALFSRSALAYCSPGFTAPLALAVGLPVIVIFGGFENSKSFSVGARFTPYCGVDVDKPCTCYVSTCKECDKTINLPLASLKIGSFISELATRTTRAIPSGAMELSPA